MLIAGSCEEWIVNRCKGSIERRGGRLREGVIGSTSLADCTPDSPLVDAMSEGKEDIPSQDQMNSGSTYYSRLSETGSQTTRRCSGRCEICASVIDSSSICPFGFCQCCERTDFASSSVMHRYYTNATATFQKLLFCTARSMKNIQSSSSAQNGTSILKTAYR